MQNNKHILIRQNFALRVLVGKVHEIDKRLIQMFPLEILLKLFVFLQERLDKFKSVGVKVERIDNNLEAFVDTEVVNHALILQRFRQL